MSTMYSRSVAMFEQAKKALDSLADTIHNIYVSMNDTFIKTQEQNNI